MNNEFVYKINHMFQNIKKTNPQMLIILVVISLIFLTFLATLSTGSPATTTYSSVLNSDIGSFTQPSSTGGTGGTGVIETIMWGVFIFLLLINGIQYLFNINIKTSLKDVFSKTPELDITVEKKKYKKSILPSMNFIEQVFHVSDNKYTYDDAKAVCKAFDSKLATYDQVESAYNNGAEWCSYGWSDEQMILYPTQKSTYNKLKSIKGHKNDCGRPGINGGYIDNPNAKFGVNCFGVKPKITPEEVDLMKTQSIFPKTKEDKMMEKKIVKFKNKIANILVSPFNGKRWSKI